MGKSGTPSWRGSGPKPQRNKPRPARGWRGGPAGGTAAGTRQFAGNWLQNGGSLLAAVACVALIYWLLIMPGCISGRLIVVEETRYVNSAVPPNPFADGDAEAFMRLNDPPRLFVEHRAGQTEFEQRLADLSSGVPEKHALAVYVNLHAGRFSVDRQGVPQEPANYFLLGNADPDATAGFVSFDKLWQALKDQPDERKKVVLLNVTGLDSEWRLGLFENRVLDGLAEAVAEIPQLVVLTSSSPGERSWASPHLGGPGQSVFGHFVLRGLAGEADADGNNRVSVEELYEFVARRTNNWVVQNRDPDGQHPQLIPGRISAGELSKFYVAAVSSAPGSAAAVSTAAPEAAALWRQIETAWQQRDALRDAEAGQPPYHRDPLRWRRLHEQLMQAEQRLRAGQADRAQTLLGEIQATLQELQAKRPIAADLPTQPFVVETIVQRTQGVAPSDEADAGRPDSRRSIRPPEVHVREMCKKHLPQDDARSRMIQRTYDVRSRAEQAAAGPLGTAPWVWNLIVEGDRHRRAAEDRLFAGLRDEAEPNFERALKLYEEAVQAAQTIDEARQVHHRLLAELPDLAAWAARRTPAAGGALRAGLVQLFQTSLAGNGGRPPDLEALRQSPAVGAAPADLEGAEAELVHLFELARGLQRQLSFAGATGRPESEFLTELKSAGRLAHNKLDELQQRLSTRAARLAEGRPSQPEDWKQLDEMLNYSLLPARTRARLNEHLRQLSSTLHEGTDEAAVDSASPGDSFNRTGGSDGVSPSRQRGVWQGLWAVQTLSLGPADDAFQLRLWQSWNNAAAAASSAGGADLLVRLGEETRQAWLAKREAIRQLLNSPTDSRDRRWADLERAERMARTLHGYDAGLLVKLADPVGELRKFQIADLTLRHADRCLEDYWAGLNPAADLPWYAEAAQQCLDAVEAARIPAFQSRLDELRGLLAARRNKDTHLAIGRMYEVVFGTERRKNVPLSIERRGPVPEGIAAVWLQPAENDLMGLHLEQGRKPVPFAAEPSEIAFEISKPADFDEADCQRRQQRMERDALRLQPHLLFRGHLWNRDTPVVVRPCRPEGLIVQYQTPPKTGDVIVHGSDRRSIVFVLDCSYSMGPEHRTTIAGRNPRDRQAQAQKDGVFNDARKGLDDTLNMLQAAVQEGEDIRVGLIAYGHRVGLRGGKAVPNPNWPANDIPLALTASAEGVLLDYQVLVPIDALKQNLEVLKERLWQPRLRHWGNTPLVGSIIEACSHLESKKTSGTIVVITDGEAQDTTRLPELRQLIRTMQVGGLSVELHMVGFALADSDRRGIERLVADLRNHPRDAIPTHLHLAPGGAQLARALREALTMRPYEVHPLDDRRASPVLQRLGQPVTGLPAGRYQLQFPERTPFDFALKGGERLEFNLETQGFRHLKHRAEFFRLVSLVVPGATARDQESIQLGLRRFQVAADRTAQFVLSLTHDDDGRIVDRPAEIQFSIAPSGDAARRSMNWKLVPGASIPTWQIELSDWPVGRDAEIRTWFKTARTPHELELESAWDGTAENQVHRLSGGIQIPPLKLVSAQFHPGERKAVVTIQTADGQAVQPEDGDLFDELLHLRVELGRQNARGRTVAPVNFAHTRRFFADEAKLMVEFDLGDYDFGDDWNPADWRILVTSWAARKAGAFHAPSPLKVSRETTVN